jgi:hypothetical protein
MMIAQREPSRFNFNRLLHLPAHWIADAEISTLPIYDFLDAPRVVSQPWFPSFANAVLVLTLTIYPHLNPLPVGEETKVFSKFNAYVRVHG